MKQAIKAFLDKLHTYTYLIMNRRYCYGMDLYFKTTDEGICLANPKSGKFIYMNPTARDWLGYDEEELMGREFLTFVHPEDVEPTLKIIEGIVGEGLVTADFRNRYRTKSGKYILIRWRSFAYGGMYVCKMDNLSK